MKSIISILLCLICYSLKAQQDTPFKSIGKDVLIHTLSGGKYIESFDNDTIQRIGTVLMNIKTKQIILLLDSDSIYKAVSDNSSSSRWHSIDPFAEKYASVSPYVFVDNNPILKIDPDGRDWIISTTKNKDGSLHYNIVFQGAIMNSSSSNINMKGLITHETKMFEKLFGKNNVTATMNLRQISSMDDLKSNEHLIEIKDPSYFAK
ncbi:hypothetical protein ACDQ55_16600 [Chitinophaga sp. 30R24]|uniref:hypothetical protein n=1 Tax=Chitinophaga sp. 30R24 TaxID=3248838 RepID=UPI003B91CA61